METRHKIRVSKSLLLALRLLEEKAQKEKEAAINDYLLEMGQPSGGTWEFKAETDQVYLIQRGGGSPEPVAKRRGRPPKAAVEPEPASD